MVKRLESVGRSKPRQGSRGNTELAEVAPLVLGQSEFRAKTAKRSVRIREGLPGEKVALSTTGYKGSVVGVARVVTPSRARVEAPCAILHRCGGCTLQELNYPAQLEAKASALKRALEEVGVRFNNSIDLHGVGFPFHFRTKLQMQAAGSGTTLRFGLCRPGSTQVESAEGCPIQHPFTIATLAQVRQTLADAGVVATTERSKLAWLHAIRIRVDPSSTSAEVVLSVNRPWPPRTKEIARTYRRVAGGSLASLGGP